MIVQLAAVLVWVAAGLVQLAEGLVWVVAVVVVGMCGMHPLLVYRQSRLLNHLLLLLLLLLHLLLLLLLVEYPLVALICEGVVC